MSNEAPTPGEAQGRSEPSRSANPRPAEEELPAVRTQAADELAALKAHAAEELAAARASAEKDLHELRAVTDRELSDARAAAAHDLEDARASAARDLDSAHAKAAGDLQQARAKAAEDLGQAHVDERQCDLACMERLVDAFRDLDAALSLSEVLDRLAEHAAALIGGRVTVLVLREGTLTGWKLHGFGPDAPDAATIGVSPAGQSVAARALQTGERATTRDAEAQQPWFAQLPDDRVGFAVPLKVGNRPVAVLYADDVSAMDRTVPSPWPEITEILARHAARCLELVTVGRAYGLHTSSGSGRTKRAPGESDAETADKISVSRADSRNLREEGQGGWNPRVEHDAGANLQVEQEGGRNAREERGLADFGLEAGERAGGPAQAPTDDEGESAQRYARLLISEIKLYHEDAVDAGCRDGNLLARLGAEIERARQLYEQRVPIDVRRRADYFGQELVRTLANGDPRLLGLET